MFPELSDQAMDRDKQQLWHSTLIKYGILKSNQFMTLKWHHRHVLLLLMKRKSGVVTLAWNPSTQVETALPQAQGQPKL